MPKISIDVNSTGSEVYLRGDITALKKHRYAWGYIKDYLRPIECADKIAIPVGEEEPVAVLTKVRDMLNKYKFTEEQSESSSKVLLDFYEEERKFSAFSEMAEKIRNNECDTQDFRNFTDAVAVNLSNRSLYPLQLLSAYHLAFSQNACNFSVPGAGKTSIVYGAYAYLHSLPKSHPKYVDRLLIVGPLSSFGPWELEYAECFGKAPSVKRLISGISKSEKQEYLISGHTFELTLVSYASLVSLEKYLGFFLRNNRVMVVLDEAHKAKNSSGGIIAQTVLNFAKYCSARVVLTGTPAPNGYEDIYNMFKFIWPTKNVIGFEVNQLRDITARGDEQRISRLISNISPYFIRIRKSDLNIPPATVHPPILVDMGPIQRRIYDFIEKKYDVLTADMFIYDIHRHKVSFRNELLPLSYASIRNVLVSQEFLSVDREQKKTTFWVHPNFESMLAQFCKKSSTTLSLKQLQARLEADAIAGAKAESFVLKYERRRICNPVLQRQIKQISEIDVCAGYDIISYENDKSTFYDRFIEVKAIPQKPSFFWSRNELEIAKLHGEKYFLYLVDLSKIENAEYCPQIISNPVQSIMKSPDWIVEPESYHVQKI